MPYSFKKILVPADFSINTEVAVKKALELADAGTIIHLLYVQPYDLPLQDIRITESKMGQWKRTIEESVGDINVCTWIMMGRSVQKCIEKKAKELVIDLIIIGKSSYHSWFPFLNTLVSSKLAFHTGIAVLTAKPGTIYNKIRTILVPVSNDMNTHKMKIISTMCRKFRVRIHLVTFLNEQHKQTGLYESSLLEAYQLIKTFTNGPVEYSVLQDSNKGKALLDYATIINADILLVHPETETRIGWMNKQISDVLPPSSKLQVLAVR